MMDNEDKAIALQKELDEFDARLDAIEAEAKLIREGRDAIRQELAELGCPYKIGDCFWREEKFHSGPVWGGTTKTRISRVFVSSILWNRHASFSWEVHTTLINKDGTPHKSGGRYFGSGEGWTPLPGRMVDGRYVEDEKNSEEGLTSSPNEV